jgi:hypothetical protein
VKPQWWAGLVFIGMAASLAVCGEAMAEVAGEVPEQTAAALAVLVGGLAQAGLAAGIALPLQYLVPAVRRRPKILSYEYWLDVLYWCQAAWLLPIAFFAVVGWVIRAAYGPRGAWFPALAEMPYWAQVVLAVWAFDFVVYWRHRLEHRPGAASGRSTPSITAAEQGGRAHGSRASIPSSSRSGVATNAAVVRLGLDRAASTARFHDLPESTTISSTRTRGFASAARCTTCATCS